MAVIKKEIRRSQKDKYRRKHRILSELRFWFLGFLVVSLIVTGFVASMNIKQGNQLKKISVNHQSRDVIALSAGETTISLMELSYFFYESYYDILESESFIRNYGAYGLDKDKPLRSIQYTTLHTWFENLMDDTCEVAESTIRYASVAKENGLQLDETERAKIDEKIQILNDRAVKEERKLDDYLDYRYCHGMTETDVREALELYALAAKQYELILDDLKKCSDDEISDYFDEHINDLLSIDYISYKFEIKADSNEKLTAFKECKTSKEFLSLIEEDLPEAGCPADQIDNVLADCQKRLQYGTKSEFATWAFDESRIIGDILVQTAGNYYQIYYLVRTGEKYNFPSANIRGLFISKEAFTDNSQTKKLAQELYEKALADGTETYFVQLVKENSYDISTAPYGGEYADVVPGDLAEEYNDWVFAEGRKAGDIGLVESDGNYHIFYYIKDGDACWKVTAKNALIDERVKAHAEAIKKDIQVELNQNEIYQNIPDNLATNYKRNYTVHETGGRVSYNISLAVYTEAIVFAAISLLLFLLAAWSFIDVAMLEKRYGYK